MTVFNFPDTTGKPTDGTFTWTAPNGLLYSWDGDAWRTLGGGDGNASITITDDLSTIPAPAAGDLAWHTIEARMYIYYQDDDSQQWVDASPAGDDGIEEAPNDGKIYGRQSNDWTEVTGGSGNTVIVGSDAWASFNGQGGIGSDRIYNSYNIASITRTAVGVYDVVFTTPMPSADYSVVCNLGSRATQTSKTVNGFTINSFTTGTSSLGDSSGIDFAVHASSSVTPTYTWTRNGTTLEPANAGDNVDIGSGNITLNADGSAVYEGSIYGKAATLNPANFTNNTAGLKLLASSAGSGQVGAEIASPGNNVVHAIRFARAGVTAGRIEIPTSGNIVYATSSDYRLKEDVKPIADSIAQLKALKPCNFLWKGSTKREDGFIAHEVQEVIPTAATGTKDGVDENGVMLPQGIDPGKLVPMLTDALQKAFTRIEALEAEVQALKGGN